MHSEWEKTRMPASRMLLGDLFKSSVGFLGMSRINEHSHVTLLRKSREQALNI